MIHAWTAKGANTERDGAILANTNALVVPTAFSSVK